VLLQGLLASARARCRAWPKLAPKQVRGFVRAVIVRITVGVARSSWRSTNAPCAAVLLPAATHAGSASFPEAEDDLIALSIQARVQRRGRAVRLMVTPIEASATAAQANPALVNVLAQGQRGLEQWLCGEVSSLRAIAKSAGKSEGYVSQVVRAAFLAPDLVEAVELAMVVRIVRNGESLQAYCRAR